MGYYVSDFVLDFVGSEAFTALLVLGEVLAYGFVVGAVTGCVV